MSQARLHAGSCSRDPSEWYANHSQDYAKVLERLSRARRVTLRGDIDDAAENLRKAYFNAVLSVRTDLDRHETAYAGWAFGDADAKDALLDTVYGGTKIHQWGAIETMENTDWRDVVLAVRSHVRAYAGGHRDRLADMLAMCDDIKGVGYRKWSFTLAMAGVWEAACIDSNVGSIMDVDIKDEFADSPERYLATVMDVRDRVDAPIPPFLAQWCIYDFARGEHARHMVFFESINLAQNPD